MNSRNGGSGSEGGVLIERMNSRNGGSGSEGGVLIEVMNSRNGGRGATSGGTALALAWSRDDLEQIATWKYRYG